MSVSSRKRPPRRSRRQSAQGNVSVPAVVPPAASATDLLHAAQARVHLEGMLDQQGNAITSADALLAELIHRLETSTSMAQWGIVLNSQVLMLRMYGRIFFTIAHMEDLLQALLLKFPSKITDVVGWKARNPCTGVSGRARVSRAQCIRAFGELVRLDSGRGGTPTPSIPRRTPTPHHVPTPPPSNVEHKEEDEKEAQLDNIALLEQGWNFVEPTPAQEADYALRPLSRYNLDSIIQDLDTALDQANGNINARVRRDNLLASLLLFKQVQRAMARFINLEVEHDHDNHDNVKYDMVDNALAILGASTITSYLSIL